MIFRVTYLFYRLSISVKYKDFWGDGTFESAKFYWLLKRCVGEKYNLEMELTARFMHYWQIKTTVTMEQGKGAPQEYGQRFIHNMWQFQQRFGTKSLTTVMSET